MGHDAILRDFVTLYPPVNVSGITNIGYAVKLRTGMQIIQGKREGDYSTVGAGAVAKDIAENFLAVGRIARPIKFL